jgi:hypothetical protein
VLILNQSIAICLFSIFYVHGSDENLLVIMGPMLDFMEQTVCSPDPEKVLLAMKSLCLLLDFYADLFSSKEKKTEKPHIGTFDCKAPLT